MAGPSSSSSNNAAAPFHPAFAVSNISNHIKITLDAENVHYAHWAELFVNTAVSYEVSDHIIPPKTDTPVTKDAQWIRLDAIVKNWIYGTISEDLLHTIIKPGATAQETWDRLADIFQDNQHSRTVYLEQEFSRISLDQYSSVSAYCQALKMIADKLSNVGAPVKEDRLVLQLIAGLSGDYSTIATLIEQNTPRLRFTKPDRCSRLRKNVRSVTVLIQPWQHPPNSLPLLSNLSRRTRPSKFLLLVSLVLLVIEVEEVVVVVFRMDVDVGDTILTHPRGHGCRSTTGDSLRRGMLLPAHTPPHLQRRIQTPEPSDQGPSTPLWLKLLPPSRIQECTFPLISLRQCKLSLFNLLMIIGTWIPGQPLI
ncbi:hypothetical protein Dimus_038772 [Dionaea muscipula]